MSDEKLIHVKMDYVDALEAKKNILNLEKKIIGLSEVAYNFSVWRTKELRTKIRLYSRMKSLSNSMKMLKKELPQTKIPKVMFKAAPREKSEKMMRKIGDRRGIEFQLNEIQEKLAALQR